MSNVTHLPPTTTFTPEQALQSALDFTTDGSLTEVLVVGYLEREDGPTDLFIRSSRMTRRDALWFAEQLRLYALQLGPFAPGP